MKKCNLNCKKCSKLNIKVDSKDYPWGYECLKYDINLSYSDFENTKEIHVT